MRISVRQTGSFYALDEGGNRHRINEFTEYVDTDNLDRNSETAASRLLMTDDGEPINELRNGWYQVVTTGVNLFRPQAVACASPGRLNERKV